MSHSMSPQKRRFHHISGSPASSSQRKRQHLVDIPTFSTPEPTFSDFTTTALSLSPSRAHSPMLLELYSSNSETYAPTENDQFELPASSASSPEFSDQFLDQFLDQFPDLFPDLSTTCQSEPSFDAFSAENEVLDNPLVLPWTEAEMEEKLSAETHSARLSIQDEIAAGKDTLALYKRQVDNYVTFMAWDQEVRVEADPRWVVQSWEPINAAKVAVYLKYVMTRAKHTPKGADIPGTRVGAGVIKQVINALEHWRFNHQHEPLYKANQSSQIPLRDDSHIKTIEKSMAALKPQRIAEAHSRKAEGSSADNYTKHDLTQASLWCLQPGHSRRIPTALQLFVAIRDRAMLLLSTCTAFRGDNIRTLLWSDLFARDLPAVDISEGATLEALVCLVDQSKTNVNGKLDEHGALRHRHVELCSIGALGLLFWVGLQVVRDEPPSFAPDFEAEGYGEFGQREWYDFHVFPATTNASAPMSYQNHANRVKLIHEKNNIEISKVTHGGRPFAAATAREHGASVSAVKALGNWSESDAYRAVYDRALPLEALLGASMFNARRPESYSLPRASIDPPPELLKLLFPWAEDELEKLAHRISTIGRQAQDFALRAFLGLLIRLRRILFQDTTVLYCSHPDLSLFNFAPFNTVAFREFAISSRTIIASAEESARLQLKNLPSHMVATMQGLATTQQVSLERARVANEQKISELSNQVQALTNVITQLTTTNGSRPRGRKLPINSSSTLLPISFPSTTSVESAVSRSANDTFSEPPPPPQDVAPSPDVTPSPPLPPHSTHYLITSSNPKQVALQRAAMEVIETKFGLERVRKHIWDWCQSKSFRDDRWVPRFVLPLNCDIETIWRDWSVGRDGGLSVKELIDGWDAEWRDGSGGQKTEASRRKRITDLVQELADLPGWDEEAALHFLHETFPISSTSLHKHLRTVRYFVEWLQKKDKSGIAEIRRAAALYVVKK